MATMKQWADKLSKEICEIKPSPIKGRFWDIDTSCSEKGPKVTFKASAWPFSGFFDWFDNSTRGYGYLPKLLKLNAVPASKNCGVDGNDYRVNPRWIFVGLNPNFKIDPAASPVNDWNFMGFNMDPNDPRKQYSLEKAGTLADLWKIMGLFLNIQNYKKVYECFKASYMTDIAVLINASSSKCAGRVIKSNPLHYYKVFKKEMEIYQKFMYGKNIPARYPDLKFLAFGWDAYKALKDFSQKNPMLFQDAQIIQLKHYSGSAVHTAQQLICLAQKYCNRSIKDIDGFPAIAPEIPLIWGYGRRSKEYKIKC